MSDIINNNADEINYSDVGKKVKAEQPSKPLWAVDIVSTDNKLLPAINLDDYQRYTSSDAFPKIGIDPNLSQQELERKFDANQSYGEAFGNTMGKLWNTSSNSFLDFFRADFSTHDSLTKHMYNELKEEKQYDIFHPNFDSRSEDTKKSFLQWIPGFKGSADNYEQFAPNLGYTIGMMGAGIAQNLVTGGILGTLGAIGGTAEKAYEGKKLYNLITGFNNFETGLGALKTINQGNSLVKGLQVGLEGYSMWSAFQSEASMESANTGQGTYDYLIDQYTKQKGLMPMGDDLKKIQEASYNAGETDYWMNAPILLVSNFIQFSRALFPTGAKMFTEATRDALKGYELEGKLGETTLRAEKTFSEMWKESSKVNRFKIAAQTVKKSLEPMAGMLTEGMEESLQRFSSTFSQDYFVTKAQKGKGNLWDSTKYSLNDITSKEGLQEFIGGAIIGMGSSMVGKISDATGLSDKFAKVTGGETKAEEKQRQAEFRTNVLDLVNKSSIDLALKDQGVVDLFRNMLLSKDVIKFNNENNLFEASNAKHLGLYNLVWSAINSGKDDFIIDAYNKYGDNADLKSIAKLLNIDENSINKDNLKQITNSIVDKIKETRESFRGVKETFSKTGVRKNLEKAHIESIQKSFIYDKEIRDKYNIGPAEDLEIHWDKLTDDEKIEYNSTMSNIEGTGLHLYAYDEAVKVAAISYQGLKDSKTIANKLVGELNNNKAGLNYSEAISLMDNNAIKVLREQVKTSLSIATEPEDKKKYQKQLDILDKAEEENKNKKEINPERIADLMHEFALASKSNNDLLWDSSALIKFQKLSDFKQKLQDIVKHQNRSKANLDIFNYLQVVDNFEKFQNYNTEKFQEFFESVKEWKKQMDLLDEEAMKKMFEEQHKKASDKVDTDTSTEVETTTKTNINTEGRTYLDSDKVKDRIAEIQKKENLDNYNIRIYKDENDKHFIEAEYKSSIYGELEQSKKDEIDNKFKSYLDELNKNEETKKQNAITAKLVDAVIKKYKDKIEDLKNTAITEADKDQLIEDYMKDTNNLPDTSELNEIVTMIDALQTIDDKPLDLQQDNTFVPDENLNETEDTKEVVKTNSAPTLLKSSGNESEDVLDQNKVKIGEVLKSDLYSNFIRRFKNYLQSSGLVNNFTSPNFSKEDGATFRLVIKTEDAQDQIEVYGKEFSNKGQVLVVQTLEKGNWVDAYFDENFDVSTVKKEGFQKVHIAFVKKDGNIDKLAEKRVKANLNKTKTDAKIHLNIELAQNKMLRENSLIEPQEVHMVGVTTGIHISRDNKKGTIASALVQGISNPKIQIAEGKKIGEEKEKLMKLNGRYVFSGSAHVLIGTEYLKLNPTEIPEDIIKKLDELMKVKYDFVPGVGISKEVMAMWQYLSTFVYTAPGYREFSFNEATGNIELQVTKGKAKQTYKSLSEYNDINKNDPNRKPLYLNISKSQLESPINYIVKDGKAVQETKTMTKEEYIKFILDNSYIYGDFELINNVPTPIYVNSYISFSPIIQKAEIEQEKVNHTKESLTVLSEKELEVDSTDENKYVDKQFKKESYHRVSILKGKFTGGKSDAADRGTIIDSLLRDFISKKISSLEELKEAYNNHKDKSKVGLFTDNFLQDLYNTFDNAVRYFEDQNIELVTNVSSLWGQLDGTKFSAPKGNYAGTVDILGIKPDGSLIIIDLKTSSQDRTDPNNNYYQKYKKDDSIQQSAYAELIRQRTGITVDSVYVLPIQVTSDRTTGEYVMATPNLSSTGSFIMAVDINEDLFPKVPNTPMTDEELANGGFKSNTATEPEVTTPVSELERLNKAVTKIEEDRQEELKKYKTIFQNSKPNKKDNEKIDVYSKSFELKYIPNDGRVYYDKNDNLQEIVVKDQKYYITSNNGLKFIGNNVTDANIYLLSNEYFDSIFKETIISDTEDKVNARYDAKYVDAVKNGTMTKEQAIKALEEAGRKNSEAYTELESLKDKVVGSGVVESIKNKQLKNTQGEINIGNIQVVENIPNVNKVIGKDKDGEDIKVVINGDKLKGTLLSKNGNYLFKAMQGRVFTLAKVGDFYLPFYISSAGTSGKIAGEWYPFFGYNNWLVKGRVGAKGEMEYSQKISEVQKLLNENFILPAKYLSADNKVAIGEQFVPARDAKGDIIREGKYNFEKMIPNENRKVLYDLSEDIDIITHHHQEQKGETKLNEHDWVAEKTGFNPKNVVNDGGNSADNWINDIIALTENAKQASKGVITKAVEQSITPEKVDEVGSGVVDNPSLKDVESTAKALDKRDEELGVTSYYQANGMFGSKFKNNRELAESYHKNKDFRDENGNKYANVDWVEQSIPTQEVKAVESLLSKELTPVSTDNKAEIEKKYKREDFPNTQSNTRTPITQKLLDYFAEVLGIPKFTEDLSKGTYINWLQNANPIGYGVANTLNAPKQAFDIIFKYDAELEALKNKFENGNPIDEFSGLASSKKKDVNESMVDSLMENTQSAELEFVKKISGRAGIKVLFEAANSEYWGTFTTAAVTLTENAVKGTGYHEAWHVFSQMFLTKLQKDKLYKEARKKIPSLKNAAPIEVEEFLADDFKKFMLTGQSDIFKSKKDKSIFQKIVDFIKNLFGLSFNIEKAYDDLRVGNLFNYKSSVDNAYWGKLNSVKGLEEVKLDKLIGYSKHADAMIGIIINTPISIPGRNVPLLIADNYNIKAALENPNVRKVIETEVYKNFQSIAENAQKSVKEDINYILNNWKTFLKFNSDYSKNSFSLLEDEIEEEEGNETDESQKDTQYNKAANEESSFSTGNDVTKQALLTVPHCIWENGTWKIVRDRNGLMKPGNPILLWNLLVTQLKDTLLEDEFYKKLSPTIVNSKGETVANPEYTKLVRKIPELGYIIENLLPKQINFQNQLTAKKAFYQSFCKPNVPIVTLVYDPRNNEYYERIETKNNRNLIQIRTSINFQSLAPQSKFFKRGIVKKVEGRNYLTSEFVNYIKKLDLSKRDDKLELLELLGFNIPTFIANEAITEFNSLTEPLTTIARSLAYRITTNSQLVTNPIYDVKTPVAWKNEKNVQEKIEGEKNSVEKLLDFLSENTLEDPSMSSRSAGGKMKHEIQAYNRITRTNYWLSRTNSYEDILRSKESYNDFTFMDVDKYATARGSLFMNVMFGKTVNDQVANHPRKLDNENKPIRIILESYDGTEEKDETGAAKTQQEVFNLNLRSKFIMDFNSLLKTGRINMLQNSSKKTYYSMRLSNMKHYITLDEVNESANPYDNIKFKNVWKNYLEAELFKVGSKKYEDMKLDNFSFFDFLDETLKEKLKKEAKQVKDGNFMKVVENNNLAISSEMNKYFDERRADISRKFAELGLNDSNISSDLIKKYDKNILFKAFVMNHYIIAMEEMKLFRADPQFYKDFYKRTGQDISTGTHASVDDAFLDFIENNQSDSLASTFGKTKTRDELSKANFITIADQEMAIPVTQPNSAEIDITGKDLGVSKIVADAAYSLNISLSNVLGKSDAFTANKLAELEKELKKYNETNITDGGGFCTLDFYKRVMIAVGNWGEKKELLYKALGIQFKLQKGFYRTEKEKEDAKKQMELFFKRSEGTVFNIGKFQVNAITIINGVEVPILHKFSLAPLFPSQIQGKELGDLHDTLLKTGADYIPFNSSSKSYTPNITELIKEGNFTTETIKEDDITSMQLSDVKEQILTASEFKQGKNLGVQVVQLAFSNLFQNGVPIDFKGTVEEFENTKYEDLSPIGRTYRDYVNAIEEIRKENRIKLYNELGIQQREDGTIEVTNTKKLIEKLHQLADARDANINIKDYIQYDETTKDFANPLDFALNVDEIKKLVNGLIDRKLRKMKVNGSMSIQMSDFGQKEKEASTYYDKELVGRTQILVKKTKNHNFRNATDKEKLEYGANGLPFYYLKKDKKGKVTTSKMGCKVTLSGDYKNLLNLKDVKELVSQGYDELTAINLLLKNPKWREENEEVLTIVGYRIPTQGPNSMDIMVIHEFLPEYMGNTIILPAGITTKSGTDYDIDKMSLFFKHIAKDGRVVSKLQAFQKQMYKEKLKESKKRLSELKNNLEELISVKNENTKTKNEIEDALIENQKILDSGLVNTDQIEETEAEMEEILEKQANLLMQYEDELKNQEDTHKELTDEYKKVINNISIYIKLLDKNAQFQNSLMDSFESILTNPTMFYHLVKPNSTTVLENLSKEIGNLVGRKTEITKGSKVIEYLSSLNKHDELQEGKALLGGWATSNKFLQNLVISNVRLRNKYIITDFKVRERTIIIRNPLLKVEEENKMLDSNNNYQLGNLFSMDGKFAQDIFSEAINMTVDIEANPFARTLGLNKHNANIAIYLSLKKVPQDRIWYFLNQPILMELYKDLNVTDGDLKVSLANMVNKYFNSSEQPKSPISIQAYLKSIVNNQEVNGHGTKLLKESLKANLTSSPENYFKDYGSKDDMEQQLFILSYFSTALQEAKVLQDMRKSSAFDSTKINGVLEAGKMQDDITDIKNSYGLIENPKDYYKRSLSMLYNELRLITVANAKLFPIASDPQVSSLFTEMRYKPYKKGFTAVDRIKAEKIVLNDLMAALIQNFGLGSITGRDESSQKSIIAPKSFVVINGRKGIWMVESYNAEKDTYTVFHSLTGDAVTALPGEITSINRYSLADTVGYDILAIPENAELGIDLLYDIIKNIKVKYPNLEKEYPVIKRLLSNIDKKKMIVNIEFYRSDANETSDKNSYIDQFNKLASHENSEIRDAFKTLMLLGFYQSGYNMSPLYFTDVISLDVMLPKILSANSVFNKIKKADPEFATELLVGIAELIRYNNPRIYTYETDQTGEIIEPFNKNYWRYKNYTLDINNILNNYLDAKTAPIEPATESQVLPEVIPTQSSTSVEMQGIATTSSGFNQGLVLRGFKKVDTITGAEIYDGNVFNKTEADALEKTLEKEFPIELAKPEQIAGNKWALKSIYYGPIDYSYSKLTRPATPMPGWLNKAVRELEKRMGVVPGYFDTALINKYTNRNTKLGMHTDAEENLIGKDKKTNPTVLTLSLGAKRIFMLEGIKNFTGNDAKLEAKHGNVLVMGKDSQFNYLHGIEQSTGEDGTRYSITLRHTPDVNPVGKAVEKPTVITQDVELAKELYKELKSGKGRIITQFTKEEQMIWYNYGNQELRDSVDAELAALEGKSTKAEEEVTNESSEGDPNNTGESNSFNESNDTKDPILSTKEIKTIPTYESYVSLLNSLNITSTVTKEKFDALSNEEKERVIKDAENCAF